MASARCLFLRALPSYGLPALGLEGACGHPRPGVLRTGCGVGPGTPAPEAWHTPSVPWAHFKSLSWQNAPVSLSAWKP